VDQRLLKSMKTERFASLTVQFYVLKYLRITWSLQIQVNVLMTVSNNIADNSGTFSTYGNNCFRF